MGRWLLVLLIHNLIVSGYTSYLQTFKDNGISQVPKEWDWTCLGYGDLILNVASAADTTVHRQVCILCGEMAPDRKGLCATLADGLLQTESGFQREIAGLGLMRRIIGNLPLQSPPKALEFVALDYINKKFDDNTGVYCYDKPFDPVSRLESPEYLSKRGLSWTWRWLDDTVMFYDIQFGEIRLTLDKPLVGCAKSKSDLPIEVRVSIGMTVLDSLNLDHPKNEPTSCFSSTPPFTVTCHYIDTFLICPATDLLRSIEYMEPDSYVRTILDFDTTCGEAEKTDVILPRIKEITIQYFKPYLTNYYRNYQPELRNFIYQFPRCWFSSDDSDYRFAAAWLGLREQSSISDNSWTYGIVSEEQCLQMAGSPVNETEFKKYYHCNPETPPANCGVIDDVETSIFKPKPKHALRRISGFEDEPY